MKSCVHRSWSQKAVEEIKFALEQAAGAGERGQHIKVAMATQLAAVEKDLADFTLFVQSQVTNSTISAPLTTCWRNPTAS